MASPRYFAIFGSMRTGSNLLERSLDAYDGLAGLGELFNRHFIGAPRTTEAFGATLAERNLDPIGFLEKAIAAHPGRIIGFRVFDGHDGRIIDHAARDAHCAKIVLKRDPLQSFLSLQIAQKTGQWMLRKEENRRLERVRFDPAAFETYRDALSTHYARIRSAIRASGQPAFEIDYEELEELDLLNGAARFAGSTAEKTAAPQKIARQNPPDAADKVENPEALAPYLITGAPAPAARPRFRALSRLTVSRGLELIFAPIPGAGDDAALDLIRSAETAADRGEKEMVTGLKPHQVERRRIRGAFVFTFVRHPAARIATVFDRLLQDGAQGANGFVLDILPEIYGAPRIDEATRDEGARVRAFEAFLAFAEDSHAGRAVGPLAAEWAPQSMLLADYAAETPPDFIGRAERAAEDAAYALGRLGVSSPETVEAFSATLTAAPETRISDAARARIETIFSRDYARLGYPKAP